ncbi:MAG TPA: metallophosphoesterase [Chloroflexota bacterium]|nr:metallophosphoesterase [Chloroflexota bacterium]
MFRIFFATDVHGSDLCWKKFIAGAKFYEANALVLGGDMTGKAVIPMVRGARGETRVELMDQVHVLKDEAAVQAMETTIANKGYYPVRLDEDQLADLRQHPERIDTLFTERVILRVREWLAYAEAKLSGTSVRCYVCPGNDDAFAIDPLLQEAERVCLGEGQVLAIEEQVSMISTGWANRTPWNTDRELDEADLGAKIEAMATGLPSTTGWVFNLHCPPHKSGLDDAPELDADMRPKYAGHILAAVGSTAVRAAIEKYQPQVSLHGHIHEGRGTSKIGRTICINPGSTYESGNLLGAVVEFKGAKLADHRLTSG